MVEEESKEVNKGWDMPAQDPQDNQDNVLL